MKKLFLSGMILAGSLVYAQGPVDVLRAELAGYDKPNLSPETQPALFALVAELSEKAGVSAPRYISMYDAIYYTTSRDGGPIQARLRPIGAYIDVTGDLHICIDVLKMLSYDEIRGVLALGLAGKAQNVPVKLAKTFIATFISTIALEIYWLKTHPEFRQASHEWATDTSRTPADYKDMLNLIIGTALIPSFITTGLYSNNLQKSVDFKAADIAEAKNIIKGIQGVARITASYQKEGLWSRYAPESLKKACDVLFYHIRPFNDDERMAYLSEK